MELRPAATESPYAWRIEPQGQMRVPAVIYADHALIQAMDHKVFEQVSNVATLPGIQQASYAMPDAHWGYGFPIGGVAAFDPEEGGVVSAGGVGLPGLTSSSCSRKKGPWPTFWRRTSRPVWGVPAR